MCDFSEEELAEYLAWLEAAAARTKAERAKTEGARVVVLAPRALVLAEPVAS